MTGHDSIAREVPAHVLFSALVYHERADRLPTERSF